MIFNQLIGSVRLVLGGRAGGFFQVAVFSGGDEPVWAGAGEVVLAEVADVGQGQADSPGPWAPGDHRGGVRGLPSHG